MAYGQPVSGLIDAGPVVPLQPPSTFEQMTKYLSYRTPCRDRSCCPTSRASAVVADARRVRVAGKCVQHQDRVGSRWRSVRRRFRRRRRPARGSRRNPGAGNRNERLGFRRSFGAYLLLCQQRGSFFQLDPQGSQSASDVLRLFVGFLPSLRLGSFAYSRQSFRAVAGVDSGRHKLVLVPGPSGQAGVTARGRVRFRSGCG